MSTTRLIVSVIMAAAISLGTAAAQDRQPAGAVSGVVVDVTGAVLPHAQIELQSAAGTTVQSTAANESGTFRIDRVPTGRYDIRVTFDGYQTTTIHITVANRAPAPLRVTMPLAGITQEVTVGNAAAEVKADAASNLGASSVDQRAIENLPVFNQDVLATMSRFLDSSAIGTNGATLVVNGVEVNNLNVSASAIQQIKINQDPYSAEYPRPGRGRIEVVLKPGSQEYHGTANLIFRDSRLDAPNVFATVKPPEQRRIVEGFLGGPFGHSDKTSFILSLRDNADDTESIVFAQGLSGLIQQNVASPYRNMLAAGTLNHQRGDNTTQSLTLSYQDQTMHNQGVGGVTLPSRPRLEFHRAERGLDPANDSVIEVAESVSDLRGTGIRTDDKRQQCAKDRGARCVHGWGSTSGPTADGTSLYANRDVDVVAGSARGESRHQYPRLESAPLR
jgi:hypothetical protein